VAASWTRDGEEDGIGSFNGRLWTVWPLHRYQCFLRLDTICGGHSSYAPLKPPATRSASSVTGCLIAAVVHCRQDHAAAAKESPTSWTGIRNLASKRNLGEPAIQECPGVRDQEFARGLTSPGICGRRLPDWLPASGGRSRCSNDPAS
jgi:hypothetical protein